MMPESGGLHDQSAKFIEHMQVIDLAMGHCDEVEQTAREREMRKASAKPRGKR